MDDTQVAQSVKHATDALSAIAIVGTIAGKLPLIAAGFAVAWYIIQMYEYFLKKYLARKYKTRRKTDK